MHIVTIMDYKGTRAITMCKAWILLVKRFNPRAHITIFYTKNIDGIRSFASRYTSIDFRKLTISQRLLHITGGLTHHPVQELQLSVWNETEKLGINKYIYIDADALVLDSLAEWWSHIDDKPYIGIPERILPNGELLLNAGVYSYSSRNGFVTLNKLLGQYTRDNNEIRIQAGQQGLLNAYFQYIHYDFTHKTVGHEYNTLARFSNVIRADDQDIIIYSGRYPILKTIYRAILGRGKEWSAYWLWWNIPKRVKILHAFGVDFKFWQLSECKSLWNYCKKAVRKSTTHYFSNVS